MLLVVWVLLARKSRKKDKESLLSDSRMLNGKYFLENAIIPIAITENGNIGYKDINTNNIKVFNIKDVNSFELITDGVKTANAGGAIVGGLLFGGVGAIIGGLSGQKEKINKIDLLFRINDFNNPVIEIPLMNSFNKSNYDIINNELKTFMATMEFIEKKAKE